MYPKFRFQPMTVADARRWIASYNAWVEVWNKHELSHDLPLSPEWAEAASVGHFGPLPRSCLMFHPRGGTQSGVIRAWLARLPEHRDHLL
jgi:hypothetical protein